MKDIVLISIPETTIKDIVTDAVKKALSEHEAQKESSDPKTVFGFSEGCKYINRSESTVYKLTSKKQIPHFKQGRKIYFLKSELDEWLLSNRVPTVQDGIKEMNDYLQKSKGK